LANKSHCSDAIQTLVQRFKPLLTKRTRLLARRAERRRKTRVAY
jgi:hypothetical protein